MKMPVFDANDRQWILHRLKRTAWIAVLLLILNVATTIGFEANKGTAGSNSKTPSDGNARIRSVSYDLLAATPRADQQPRSIAPTGWRRTNRGWEHVSVWGSPSKSIHSLMETQEAREPALARGLLAKVGKFSPVTFAICQVGAIVAIILATRCISLCPKKEKVVL